MSEENDPKPAGESADSKSDESAAAAKEAAQKFANNAGAMFKGLNQQMQIYLVALAVTLFCSIAFGAFKSKTKLSKEATAFTELAGQLGAPSPKQTTSYTFPSLFGLRNHSGALGGKLAFLGAAAGIGILVWSTLGKRKDPWIPLAIAGAAGAAVLGILMSRMGLYSYSAGDYGWAKHSINGTILGWWLPLAAAGIATAVSVQRILKAGPPAAAPRD